MRPFDPFSSHLSTKIGIFIKKVCQNSFWAKKNRARFFDARFRTLFFISCTNREIVHEFFRDFEPCLRQNSQALTTR